MKLAQLLETNEQRKEIMKTFRRFVLDASRIMPQPFKPVESWPHPSFASNGLEISARAEIVPIDQLGKSYISAIFIFPASESDKTRFGGKLQSLIQRYQHVVAKDEDDKTASTGTQRMIIYHITGDSL